MSLKKNIVIVNEYSNSKGGSRGGTSPGKYVERYMNRKDASEVLTPFGNESQNNNDVFITRYMLREQATERLKLERYSNRQLSEEFDDLDKLGGRAFGSSGISLSDEQVRADSKVIQKAYDDGHSVQKTILSFTEDYLKETGVVSKDFKHQGRGSYKGKVDQLKLRESIMNGMDKYLTLSGFEAPKYVGVIQMDTNYVHAHLATVDTKFSSERLMPDGTDRGKILERDKEVLRKGINDKLADMSHLNHYAEQVSVESSNMRSYVEDYTMEKMNQNAQLQSVIAALPDDKSLWRHKTNNRQMKRANELAESYVIEIFNKFPEESGYNAARQGVMNYANTRREVEGLSDQRYKQLIQNGYERIMERSVNGVYKSIDYIDKTQLHVNTPPLDKQARLSDSLRFDEDELAGFELRVRGYSKRKNKHETSVDEYADEVEVFDNQMNQQTPDEAFGLRRMYMQEMLYHMKCADKYRRHFLLDKLKDEDILPEFQKRFEDLEKEYEEIQFQSTVIEKTQNHELMVELVSEGVIVDSDSWQDDLEAIDVYMGEHYNVSSGIDYLRPDLLEKKIDSFHERKEVYHKNNDQYMKEAWKNGLINHTAFEEQALDLALSVEDYAKKMKNGEVRLSRPVEPKNRGEHLPDVYKDVKALDVHNLGEDYTDLDDLSISEDNLNRFNQSVRLRQDTLSEATDFLERTGQVGRSEVVLNVSDELTQADKTLQLLGVTREIPRKDVQAIKDELNTNTIRIHDEFEVLETIRKSTTEIHNELQNGQEIRDRDSVEI